MSVAKDLANCSTNMFFLYRVASIGPGKVHNYLGEGTTTLPREIALEKNPQPKNFLFNIFKRKLQTNSTPTFSSAHRGL